MYEDGAGVNLIKAPLYPVMEEDPRSVTISTFKAGCGGSTAELPGGKGDIGVHMTLTMPEAKHRTGKVKKVAFPLFVALLDQEDNVLDRQDESVKMTISDHSLNHIHKITYRPPEGIDIGSADCRLLVGFNGPAVADHSLTTQVYATKKAVLQKIRKGKVRQKGIVKKRVRE